MILKPQIIEPARMHEPVAFTQQAPLHGFAAVQTDPTPRNIWKGGTQPSASVTPHEPIPVSQHAPAIAGQGSGVQVVPTPWNEPVSGQSNGPMIEQLTVT
jgi:hypothetical protein